ncbi:Rpn family recombination-promoting nuclease/putative transposase [Romboutsia ilealis]|uniref:Rpn family recombination-promoting nuclease/putative transposase n=1 Tax=Romboutsia ilealis TaxID=1115758 RepID=UPI002676C601|nr:Rpn family recombination-promoting nuclease/putative transposase [Romboutsia ilealis]
MQRRLLNPKIDFVFKKIFGSEENPKILIGFLNAVLKPIIPIVEVEIKNTDIEKVHVEDKFSRLDVKAKTSNQEIINIEIQLKNEYNMIQRSLYYWSKLYEEQLGDGDRYDKLCRTVCINILDFKYLKNDRFHNGYRLKEIETNEELTDIEEIHFIEIPKLKKLNSEEEVVDMLEAWVEFLRDPESEVVRKLEMSNSEIREAKDKLYKLSMDEKERELYFLREKSIKDEISALANAEEKGIQIGIEQGIKQGIQREKIETVLRLHSLGLNVEQIAKGTCITETEVEKIIKENIN